MSEETTPPFTRADLEAMNNKAIENQFFTPDHVYLDLSLFKDFTVGAMFTDAFNGGEDQFRAVQAQFLEVVKPYQIRTYDTCEPYLEPMGYSDEKIQKILKDPSLHHQIFLLSPATGFLNYLIRHTIRNQNHSNPAGKHIKRKRDKDTYTLESVPVTYYINTYPLTLSPNTLSALAKELGESLGVNIQFLSKDPHFFNKNDWDQWMEKIDCFYLNSLGRFTSGDMVYDKQGKMTFAGVYLFARKRFEKYVIPQMKNYDFSQQIAALTAQLDMLCDFDWIPNKDLLLIPDESSQEEPSPPTE